MRDKAGYGVTPQRPSDARFQAWGLLTMPADQGRGSGAEEAQVDAGPYRPGGASVPIPDRQDLPAGPLAQPAPQAALGQDQDLP